MSRRSTTRGDRDSGLPQVVGGLEAAIVRRDDDRAPSGPDGEITREPANRARQHDPDEIVAWEHDRLLERSGGDDDALRAEAIEHGLAVDRDEAPLPDPERPSRREHLDTGERRPTKVPALVHEHDSRPLRRRRERSRATGLPAADDEHACAAVFEVVAPGVPAPLVDAAKPREVAENLLVERPEPPRADHRAVVEADRRERPTELVRDAQDVEIEIPPDVLSLHVRALAQRLDTHAHVRDAVHAHHAVRAVAGTAEEPAIAVVLERT